MTDIYPKILGAKFISPVAKEKVPLNVADFKQKVGRLRPETSPNQQLPSL